MDLHWRNRNVSIVDYVIANEKAKENIKRVEKEDRSDHVNKSRTGGIGHADKKTKREDKNNRKK